MKFVPVKQQRNWNDVKLSYFGVFIITLNIFTFCRFICIFTFTFLHINMFKHIYKHLQILLQNVILFLVVYSRMSPQPAITCSKLTIETLEQSVKYVQS